MVSEATQASEIVFYQPHLLSKILFFFKGLQTPSAMAINEAKKKKEIMTDIKDLGEFIADFYGEDISDEYLILDNNITFMFVAITPLPMPDNDYQIPPLVFGSFFRHNLFSYRERDFSIDEYHILFEFIGIIPPDDSDSDDDEF